MKALFAPFLPFLPFLPFFTLAGALVLGGMHCGPLSPAATVAVDATVCVLEHITDPPVTIAVTCFNDVAQLPAVNQILAAHYAAEAREGVAPTLTDAGK